MTFEVDEQLAGQTLAAVVRAKMDGVSWNRARELCQRGKVFINGARVIDSAVRLHQGATVEVKLDAPRVTRGALDASAVLHADHDVVVVNKPVGVLSVPYEETDRDTLIDQTRAALGKRNELGAVQRLDKETSGVMLFTRTLEAKRQMQQQFRAHSIERLYIAIAHGDVVDARHDTILLKDRGDGLRGSYGRFRRPKGPAPEDAQQAITFVRRLEPLSAATLIECQLETGRQHQIRIHLSESGHPLVGERVYIRDFLGEKIAAPRPMLHARVLGFVHPTTGEDLRFEVDAPADFAACLSRLRGA
jgi:23S rRNA pseudouridine1911/1915/1917 synthase